MRQENLKTNAGGHPKRVAPFSCHPERVYVRDLTLILTRIRPLALADAGYEVTVFDNVKNGLGICT